MPGRPTQSTTPSMPPSAANFWLSACALIPGLAVIGTAARVDGRWTAWLGYQPLLPCLAIVLTIVAGEHRLRARGRLAPGPLARARLRDVDAPRVALRLLGLAGTLALLACAYAVLPEYRGRFYTCLLYTSDAADE